MSSFIDDFDLDENSLPPQGEPKPIAGKAKRNIQYWMFGLIILIALPVAIWQGRATDETNIEEWKVKEKERTASTARSNQAQLKNVDEIALIAKNQEVQAQENAKIVENADANSPNRPMPGAPTSKPEELPMPPLKHGEVGSAASVAGQGNIDPKREFNTAITTGSILLLSGSNKQIKEAAQQIAGNYTGTAGLSPDMFMSKTPPVDPTAGILSALQNAQMKTPSPSSRAEEQWMKEKQQTAPSTTASGLSLTPAHKGTSIMAGSLIDAVFLTAINTDLPGEVTALVTRDVFDSVNPTRYILIPRGSKVIGEYNSTINVGQERIMMAFKRIIFPDASSIDLQGMPGADALGRSGLQGDVNNHFFKMFGTSFLIAGLTRLITPNTTVNINGAQNSSNGSFSTDAGKILVDIATSVNQKNTKIGPTITIPEGSHFNIRVNKDMHLPPYKMR